MFPFALLHIKNRCCMLAAPVFSFSGSAGGAGLFLLTFTLLAILLLALRLRRRIEEGIELFAIYLLFFHQHAGNLVQLIRMLGKDFLGTVHAACQDALHLRIDLRGYLLCC